MKKGTAVKCECGCEKTAIIDNWDYTEKECTVIWDNATIGPEVSKRTIRELTPLELAMK